MTASDWKAIRQDAKETLQNIDMSKLTQASYTLLGASLAILDHDEGKDIPAGIMPAIEPQDSPKGYPIEDIEDELGDAEKYLKRYADIMDIDYLQMSFDETSHALKFIKALHDSDEKRECMARHDQIVDRIKAYGMTV